MKKSLAIAALFILLIILLPTIFKVGIFMLAKTIVLVLIILGIAHLLND